MEQANLSSPPLVRLKRQHTDFFKLVKLRIKDRAVDKVCKEVMSKLSDKKYEKEKNLINELLKDKLKSFQKKLKNNAKLKVNGLTYKEHFSPNKVGFKLTKANSRAWFLWQLMYDALRIAGVRSNIKNKNKDIQPDWIELCDNSSVADKPKKSMRSKHKERRRTISVETFTEFQKDISDKNSGTKKKTLSRSLDSRDTKNKDVLSRNLDNRSEHKKSILSRSFGSNSKNEDKSKNSNTEQKQWRKSIAVENPIELEERNSNKEKSKRKSLFSSLKNSSRKDKNKKDSSNNFKNSSNNLKKEHLMTQNEIKFHINQAKNNKYIKKIEENLGENYAEPYIELLNDYENIESYAKSLVEKYSNSLMEYFRQKSKNANISKSSIDILDSDKNSDGIKNIDEFFTYFGDKLYELMSKAKECLHNSGITADAEDAKIYERINELKKDYESEMSKLIDSENKIKQFYDSNKDKISYIDNYINRLKKPLSETIDESLSLYRQTFTVRGAEKSQLNGKKYILTDRNYLDGALKEVKSDTFSETLYAVVNTDIKKGDTNDNMAKKTVDNFKTDSSKVIEQTDKFISEVQPVIDNAYRFIMKIKEESFKKAEESNGTKMRNKQSDEIISDLMRRSNRLLQDEKERLLTLLKEKKLRSKDFNEKEESKLNELKNELENATNKKEKDIWEEAKKPYETGRNAVQKLIQSYHQGKLTDENDLKNLKEILKTRRKTYPKGIYQDEDKVLSELDKKFLNNDDADELFDALLD